MTSRRVGLCSCERVAAILLRCVRGETIKGVDRKLEINQIRASDAELQTQKRFALLVSKVIAHLQNVRYRPSTNSSHHLGNISGRSDNISDVILTDVGSFPPHSLQSGRKMFDGSQSP